MHNYERLLESDRRHLIHPAVSLRDHERRGSTILKSGSGCYVTDSTGQELLDGFSGLWCVNAGYGQESLIDAALDQLRRLPYATGYFHYGSEPAIRLASTLAELAPGDLNRVFFTLGGSDAIDTVVRMVRYYNNALGRPYKKHFIALENAYHGSSSSGSGLTALSLFHHNFDVPLRWQHHIECPNPYRHPLGPDPDAVIGSCVSAFRRKVEEVGLDNVAAFVMEPVQGSGGVVVPPVGFAKAMQEACRELGILFVVDEVITAFGRTGPLFASEHEELTPDLMTIAKGLTSGYLPMGAVLMSDSVYDVIADATPANTPLGHGFTYSGHPVSAAVGLAVMKLYTDGGLIQNGRIVGEYFERRLAEFAAHGCVGDVRSKGLLAAVELVADKPSKRKPDPSSNIGAALATAAYENRLIIRAFVDGTIGLAPPLCITKQDVDHLMDRLTKTLLQVEGQLS